jgi:hypothetical protein
MIQWSEFLENYKKNGVIEAIKNEIKKTIEKERRNNAKKEKI